MKNNLPVTPMEDWIKERTGIVDAESLLSEQMRRLRAMIDYAKRHSPFYRDHLSAVESTAIRERADLALIPFTGQDMLRENPLLWLCVGQKEISRIVTLESSGTEGSPKRVFFTEEDQELTVDFFSHGMLTMVKPPALVMILMPGTRPGSIGDLLAKGLERQGIESRIHGPVASLCDAYEVLLASQPHCLVGIPNQVLALARYGESRGNVERKNIQSVLLSADYVPQALCREIERLWQCRVFSHYGMTEMGLGGGVECAARDGYHMREADLFIEIIDPETGVLLPDGEEGEVVFTTLTRKGMPLIRYRTGDLSRWRLEPCPCGAFLRRLAPVSGRNSGIMTLSGEGTISQPQLDEALFSIEGLMDFNAALEDGRLRLKVRGREKPDFAAIERKIRPILAAAAGKWELKIEWEPLESFSNRGTWKRKIEDLRKK